MVIHAKLSRTILAIAGGLAVSACGGGEGEQSLASAAPSTTLVAAPPQGTTPPPTSSALTPSSVTQIEADQLVLDRFPLEMAAISRGGAEIDEEGLLARNREWEAMFSPRFQTAAGLALRVGLASADWDKVANGFAAIEAGLEAVEADGTVRSSLPQDRFPGAELSDADQASAAAFFLASVFPALSALEKDERASNLISSARIGEANVRIASALTWLGGQTALLEDYDAAAPNRLLYDALAFQSCGSLVDDADARKLADGFVERALDLFREDGVFVEGGGSDTNYQAVANVVAAGLLQSQFDGELATELLDAWDKANIWLADQIRADGSIDSSANTRSCGGGEAFLGSVKLVSPARVFEALAYHGVLEGNTASLSAAERVSQWVQANPGADPCR